MRQTLTLWILRFVLTGWPLLSVFANTQSILMSFVDPGDEANQTMLESFGKSLLDLSEGGSLRVIATSPEYGRELAQKSFGTTTPSGKSRTTLEPFLPLSVTPFANRNPREKLIIAIGGHGG